MAKPWSNTYSLLKAIGASSQQVDEAWRDYRRKYMRSQRWQDIRTKALERSGRTCEQCGRRQDDGYKLDVHHITYMRLGGELMEDVHYRIDNLHLIFNVKQVYGIYAESHRRFYNVPGLTQTNLRDKLKIHPAYSGYTDSVRITAEGKTSAYLFHYDKVGVDLIAARDVFKGMRRSANPMNESYQDKVDRNKGMFSFEPVIHGPNL